MKAGKEHRVPLSTQAIALLAKMPRDGEFVFPGRDKDSILSDVSMTYIMRTSFASKELPVGITVGQAIKDQELWLESQKVDAAKAEELKKKVKAERKAKQEAFVKMLSVALVAKRNKLGEYDQRMVLLDLAYENKSDKDIAGVEGVLHLNDMFGDKIMNIRWSFDEGVGAKQTAVERGNGIKINQFMDDHMKLWSADSAKIKANYEVQKIVFKDGTRLDTPE